MGEVRRQESGDRRQSQNGAKIAQSVLLVEFVELVLLVNVLPPGFIKSNTQTNTTNITNITNVT